MSNRPRIRPSKQTQRTRSSQQGESRSRLLYWVAGGVVVVVIVAVVLAFALSSDDGGSESAGDQTGFAEVVGSPLPTFGGPGEDPAIGTEAPTMRAQEFGSDNILTIDVADGNARVIGFFAHWCPHCQDELPRLTEWLDTNTLPEGVEVMAVSTSVEPSGDNYPPSAWFERDGWPELVVRDSSNNALATGYGLRSFPYFVVTDGEGKVLGRVSGELSDEGWEQLIDVAATGVGVVGTGGEDTDVE